MIRHFCNKCGKEFDEFDFNNGAGLWQKAHYGSKYDGSMIYIDLCVSCMDELIDSCAIDPFERFESDNGGVFECMGDCDECEIDAEA